MGIPTRLRGMWRTIVHGRALDADLDVELGAYLEELIERRVQAGQPRVEARRAVLAEIGSIESVKDRVREGRTGMAFEEILRDVAYTARGLRRAPAFTLAALVTLSLGVGALTAIYSVTYALLVRPLPFRAPDRLMFVWADQTAEGYPRAPLSGPELKDLDERSTQFEGFGAIWATTAALTGEDDPEQLRIGMVTTDYFSLLGAEATLGRTFRLEDETADAPTTILLSGAVWQRRYGSDPGIVGRRIDVNGRPTVVVGVMPADFRLMMPPDAAVPDDLEAWQLFNRAFTEGPRGQRYLRVIGRMRPGVSDGDAAADIARVGREISAAHAYYGAAGRQFEAVPLHVDAVSDVRRPLLLLTVGVSILLLIACINVGSLIVARTATRAREAAVKVALGAGRRRIVRQHLIEALMLGTGGGVLGVVAGAWWLALLRRATPATLGRVQLADVNWPVAAVAVCAVVGWMALLTWPSAMQSARQPAAGSLSSERGHTGGRTRIRLRQTLTVAQVALSVVLVVSALLLTRTVQRVQRIDPGFDHDGVTTFRVAIPASRYPNQVAFNAFSRRLQEALAAIPGVAAASAWSHAPYDHVPNWGGPFVATEGADPSTAPQADYRAVAPGAMELLGVRLLDGRWFTEDDSPNSLPVVIVDDRLARRVWPGDSGIGRRIAVDPTVTGTPTTWATVVGVVPHLRHRTPVEEVRDQVYFSSRQVQRNPSVYFVKSPGSSPTLVAAVRDAIRALDGALPIYDVQPLGSYVERARALRAFTAFLASVFAGAALLLAAVGIYGVMAYVVSERRRELALRLALGASTADILQQVGREAAWMTSGGTALGLAGAAAGSWWLRTQLVGVAPWDPWSIGATVLVLALVSVLACAAPARRALHTEPSTVLRES